MVSHLTAEKYFYQPDAASIAAGQTVFIPQGRVLLGIFTVIGAVTSGMAIDQLVLTTAD